jgi:hypothetical protein
MKVTMKKLLLTTMILTAAGACCFAQQADSVDVLRLFMKVCNNYKQYPVQVDLDILNSANYVLEPEDTGHIRVKFSLLKEGTYIGFGELEQIANDSLMLLVSKKQKKMLLYRHHRSVADQLLAYMGWQIKDSSLVRLAGRYKVRSVPYGKDTTAIEISAKGVLKLTTLPKEELLVRYNPASFEPYEVRQVKRTLMRITEAAYRQLAAEPEDDKHRLVHADSSYYIVREQSSVYRYDRIAHQRDAALPVTIADRIRKGVTGEYQPVGGYEGFAVSREF